MTRFQMLTTALLVTFSLMAFVLWQIYVMYNISKQHLGLAKVITTQGADFDRAMQEHQQIEALERARLAKIWPPVFWITTAPGILGAGVLLYAFVRNLASG